MYASPASRTSTAASNRHRGLMSMGPVPLLLACFCIVVGGVLGGGALQSGKLAQFGPWSPAPVARVVSALALQSSTAGPNSPSAAIPPTNSGSALGAKALAAAAASATPSPSLNWPVVLSDTFSSNANGWNIADTQPDTLDFGTVNEQIGNGKLHLEANVTKGVNLKYWSKNLQAFSDQSVTVDSQRLSGSSTDYGLFFRRDSNNNCYVLLVRDADKQFAVYVYQGQWINLIDWTNSDAIQPGQVNHINVTAVGSHFTFSINNQQVAALDNNQLSSGVAGVVFDMSANSQAVFEFSNFELRAPAANVLSTPSGQQTLTAATPSAQWPDVLSETFASNANGWNIADQQPGTDDYGTYTETIGSGKLRIDAHVLKGTNQKRWPKISPVSDFSLSVDAQRVSGPTDAAYGVMFRRDTNGNFYLFEIADNKQFSVWLFQGQWTSLVNWTTANSIQPGQVNHLNMTAVGSHFTFSVNNQEVGSVDNSQTTSGLVGVEFDMDPGEAVFEFSNFELRAPAANVLSTPSGQQTLTAATPSAQWPVILSETFASNANGWNIADQQPGTDDYGTYTETIGSGKLKIDAHVLKGTNQKRWPKISPVSDFSLSVDAHRVSGPTDAAYGVMCRRDTNGNFYVFEINDNKQFSVWLFQEQWTELVNSTSTDAIQPGQVNHINVTAVGSHFTFSINDQEVGSVDNSQATSGLVGVEFNMDPGEAVFEFSNVVLRAP